MTGKVAEITSRIVIKKLKLEEKLIDIFITILEKNKLPPMPITRLVFDYLKEHVK